MGVRRAGRETVFRRQGAHEAAARYENKDELPKNIRMYSILSIG